MLCQKSVDQVRGSSKYRAPSASLLSCLLAVGDASLDYRVIIPILLISIVIAKYAQRKKLKTLERVGWVTGILSFVLFVFFSSEASFPFLTPYRTAILFACLISFIFSGTYSFFVERFLNLPKIMLQPNIDDQGTTLYNFVVQSKNKRIPSLQVQTTYGWGSFNEWLHLDLRQYSADEVVKGKTGDPVTQISMERHGLKIFTFATFWAPEKRIRFKITQPDIRPTLLSNAVLNGPHPEIYAKFIGLSRDIEKRYVAVFNSPPWTLDNPSVDLIDARSRKGRHLIAEREKMLGRRKKDERVTVFQQTSDGVIAMVARLKESSKSSGKKNTWQETHTPSTADE